MRFLTWRRLEAFALFAAILLMAAAIYLHKPLSSSVAILWILAVYAHLRRDEDA